MAALKKAKIEFDPTADLATLEALLPAEEADEEESEDDSDDEEESDEGEEEESEKPAKKGDKDFPSKLPVKTETFELGGKPHTMGVFFIQRVGDRVRMYDYAGRAVSPIYSPTDVLPGSENDKVPTNAQSHIAKAAAKFNAQRRSSFQPGENDRPGK